MKRCNGLIGLVMGHKFQTMILRTQAFAGGEGVIACQRCGAVADVTPPEKQRERDEFNKILGEDRTK